MNPIIISVKINFINLKLNKYLKHLIKTCASIGELSSFMILMRGRTKNNFRTVDVQGKRNILKL